MYNVNTSKGTVCTGYHSVHFVITISFVPQSVINEMRRKMNRKPLGSDTDDEDQLTNDYLEDTLAAEVKGQKSSIESVPPISVQINTAADKPMFHIDSKTVGPAPSPAPTPVVMFVLINDISIYI